MSGESTPRATLGTESLERVFGARAVCNACAVSIEGYRIVAVFLHDTAAVRAYCGGCYPAAADGDYRAAGDGFVTDYLDFAARFGAPGPPPPPPTPVDRLLSALIRDPTLRRLSPASEAIARRRREVPYPVRAEFMIAGGTCEAGLTVATAGRVIALTGHPAACARVRELLGAG